MEIISPSVEVLTPIDSKVVLDHLERCGRVCYKSENLIKEGSAEKFLRGIISRGHEAVLEHYDITVKFTCDRGVSHEIVRHRMASYCVTGDTVLRSMSQKSWTVEELFDWQTDPKRKGRLGLINLRSVDEATRTIVPNKVLGIYCVGEKAVFRLTTESGRSIKCTADHKIATPNGYKELQELEIGDSIWVNGRELLDNPDWIRWFYIEENHTKKETAKVIGCCEATLYKALKKYGIKKPLSDRPNRAPGHGVKGMFSGSTLKEMSESKKGNKNPAYKHDRDTLSISGGYQEAKRLTEKVECDFCGRTQHLEIHHIDKNPRHNTSDNIKTLCTKCHHLWHKPGAIGVFQDKVVSIEQFRPEKVYDVAMAAPYHNFVANGIVVHNCQESSRYCSYIKDKFGNQITVIKPCFLEPDTEPYALWENACKFAETAYFAMLRSGNKPEEARAVLPNSLKTELVMTANIREWRHFFKLRCDEAAHPQAREVAYMLLEEFKKLLPVLFDDL